MIEKTEHSREKTHKRHNSRTKFAAALSLALLTSCGTPSLEKVQEQKAKIESIQTLLDRKIEERTLYISYIETCDATESDPTASEKRKKNAESNEAQYRAHVDELTKEIHDLKEKKEKAETKLENRKYKRAESGIDDDELPNADEFDDDHS